MRILVKYWGLSLSFLTCICPLKADEIVEQKEAAANTIALINHINYVVETIRSYNNVLILEQEYKNISVDNLNLNKIPDEEVLKLITDIIEALSAMRMDERRLKRAEQLLERGMADKKMQNMLDAAQKLADAGLNTDGGLFKRLVAVGKTAIANKVEGYVSYKKVQRELQNEWDDKKFELDTEKLNRIHNLNVELLKAEWGLIRKYSLSDNLRVTGNNIQRLVECLKDENRKRAYRRLLPMEHVFSVYPTYWYYRSMFALEAGIPEDALASARRFTDVNRGLFRKDDMAAATAMAEISAMVECDKIDKQQIKNRLQLICGQNYDSSNADYGIFCASVYNEVLDDPKTAIEVLGPVKDLLEFTTEGTLLEYRDLYSSQPRQGLKLCPPHVVDLTRCRMLKLEIDQKQNKNVDIEKLKVSCSKETTSSLEKLFYFGRLRVADILKEASKDIWMINLYCEVADDGNQKFVAEIPMKWFLLGDMPISLVLMKGSNGVTEIKGDDKTKREILFAPRFKEKCGGVGEVLGVRIEFPQGDNALNLVDGFMLKMTHRSWPVEILYLPGAGYDIMGGVSDCKSYMTPILVAKFMGKGFGDGFGSPLQLISESRVTEERVGKNWRNALGPEELDGNDSKAYSCRPFSRLIAKEKTKVAVNCHGIVSLEMPSDDVVRLWYKNDSDSERRQGIIIFDDNLFGARMSFVTNDVCMKPHESGYVDVRLPMEESACRKEGFSRIAVLRGSIDEMFGAKSPERRVRDFMKETFGRSGIENGTDVIVVTDERTIKFERLRNALEEIYKRWKVRISSEDVMVFIDESANGSGDEGVIITCETLYYFRRDDGLGGRLDDIENVDWERTSGGCVYINGRACRFIVNNRKPFVDALRKVLVFRKKIMEEIQRGDK